ncbi:hypothetical protein CRYUN_Cryun39dG0022500 [Craigia yunnanensis]
MQKLNFTLSVILTRPTPLIIHTKPPQHCQLHLHTPLTLITHSSWIFDHGNRALDVSEHRARIEQKKRFEGSVKGIDKESKTRMAEGFPKNSKNVTFKDTTSGSIQKFGLELEGRLRGLEELVGISPKSKTGKTSKEKKLIVF